jgi:hypothetical protein
MDEIKANIVKNQAVYILALAVGLVVVAFKVFKK